MTWLAETAMLAHGWRRLLLVYVAGAIGALAMPPLFWLPALFLALPVLVWSLDGAERGRGPLRLFGPAFRIGLFFGWGYFTVSFHWLGAAFFHEGGWYPALMPVAILALALLIALFWGLATALAHLLWSDSGWRIVTLAVFLAAAEWARGTLFSGFPFDLLGYALTANDEMAQLASVVGIYGLTLIAALLAMSPALIWPADGRVLTARLAPFFAALAVVAVQIGFGGWRLATTEIAPRDDMRLRLVQPMITEHTDWRGARPAEIVARLIALSEGGRTPDQPGLTGVTHVVWPESVLPLFLSQYPEALALVARMLPPDTTLLTGAPREDSGTGTANPGYNSLLAISSDGEVVSSYDKSHLVPFGEYLPFADFFARFGIRQFVPGTNGWAPGDGRRLMAPPGTPAFVALICYEAIFSGLFASDVPRAQFMLNITNDAWFDGSVGPEKHAHHARMRAVETGLPMVRVGNSGVTFLADPLGRISASLSPGLAGVLDGVPSRPLAAPTPFSRFGPWPFFGGLLAGLAIALLSRRRRPRAAA